MKIERFYHSCVQLTEWDTKILIDPGIFCFLPGRAKPEDFQNISAVFISHNHADHADPAALKVILQNNQCRIYSSQDVAEKLGTENIQVEVMQNSETVNIGSFEVFARDAKHEVPPLEESTPQNTAFVVNKKYLHPGDSINPTLQEFAGIEILGLPVAAPSIKLQDAMDFAKSMKPKKAIAIHNGMMIDAYNERFSPRIEAYLKQSEIEYFKLASPEEFLEA